MQTILNKEPKDLTVSFNKFDYIFAIKKPVQIEDDLANHLKEVLPLSFEFEPELKKDAVVSKVHRVPTKVMFPGGKFGVPSQNLTRESVDGLDESFIGPGLEDDSL